jgi:hypothetical protein
VSGLSVILVVVVEDFDTLRVPEVQCDGVLEGLPDIVNGCVREVDGLEVPVVAVVGDFETLRVPEVQCDGVLEELPDTLNE